MSSPKKTAKSADAATVHARIRAIILSVPHGKVATYGSVARAAGYPRGSRLVARVLGKTAGLPWQRILGSGGAIKIPGEGGMEQRFRLQMEGVTFRGRRVDMKLHEFKFTKAPRGTAKKKHSQAQSKRARNR